MKLAKITIGSGTNVFINTDNICDIRQDPMSETHTIIQLSNGLHKVKLSVPEVLKLIGAKDIL
jgi:hypothetical protein